MNYFSDGECGCNDGACETCNPPEIVVTKIARSIIREICEYHDRFDETMRLENEAAARGASVVSHCADRDFIKTLILGAAYRLSKEVQKGGK